MVKSKKEGYFSKLANLFFHPNDFLKSIDKEKDYQPIMFFYVKTFIIVGIIGLLTSMLVLSDLFSLTSGLFNLVTGIIFSFALPFVYGGVIHLGVLIFGGKQAYFNTYKAVTYGSVIGLLYNLLISPLGGFLSLQTLSTQNFVLLLSSPAFIFLIALFLVQLVHSLYFFTIGLSKFQKISKARAFLSAIIVPAVLIILVGLLIAFATALV